MVVISSRATMEDSAVVTLGGDIVDGKVGLWKLYQFGGLLVDIHSCGFQFAEVDFSMATNSPSPLCTMLTDHEDSTYAFAADTQTQQFKNAIHPTSDCEGGTSSVERLGDSTVQVAFAEVFYDTTNSTFFTPTGDVTVTVTLDINLPGITQHHPRDGNVPIATFVIGLSTSLCSFHGPSHSSDVDFYNVILGHDLVVVFQPRTVLFGPSSLGDFNTFLSVNNGEAIGSGYEIMLSQASFESHGIPSTFTTGDQEVYISFPWNEWLIFDSSGFIAFTPTCDLSDLIVTIAKGTRPGAAWSSDNQSGDVVLSAGVTASCTDGASWYAIPESIDLANSQDIATVTGNVVSVSQQIGSYVFMDCYDKEGGEELVAGDSWLDRMKTENELAIGTTCREAIIVSLGYGSSLQTVEGDYYSNGILKLQQGNLLQQSLVWIECAADNTTSTIARTYGVAHESLGGNMYKIQHPSEAKEYGFAGGDVCTKTQDSVLDIILLPIELLANEVTVRLAEGSETILSSDTLPSIVDTLVGREEVVVTPAFESAFMYGEYDPGNSTCDGLLQISWDLECKIDGFPLEEGAVVTESELPKFTLTLQKGVLLSGDYLRNFTSATSVPNNVEASSSFNTYLGDNIRRIPPLNIDEVTYVVAEPSSMGTNTFSLSEEVTGQLGLSRFAYHRQGAIVAALNTDDDCADFVAYGTYDTSTLVFTYSHMTNSETNCGETDATSQRVQFLLAGGILRNDEQYKSIEIYDEIEESMATALPREFFVSSENADMMSQVEGGELGVFSEIVCSSAAHIPELGNVYRIQEVEVVNATTGEAKLIFEKDIVVPDENDIDDCYGGNFHIIRSQLLDLGDSASYSDSTLSLAADTETLLEVANVVYLECTVDGTQMSTVGHVTNIDIADDTTVTLGGAWAGDPSCDTSTSLTAYTLYFRETFQISYQLQRPPSVDEAAAPKNFFNVTEEIDWKISADFLPTNAFTQCLQTNGEDLALKAPTLDIPLGMQTGELFDETTLSYGWWNDQPGFAITESAIREGRIGGTAMLAMALVFDTDPDDSFPFVWSVPSTEDSEQTTEILRSSMLASDHLEHSQVHVDLLASNATTDGSNTETLVLKFSPNQDFDISSVLSITLRVPLTVDSTSVVNHETPNGSELEIRTTLHVFPDGYLDEPLLSGHSGLTHTSGGSYFITWTHGLSTAIIVSAYARCVAGGVFDVDTYYPAVYPSIPFIRWTPSEMFPRQPAPDDVCQVISEDMDGNQMGSWTVGSVSSSGSSTPVPVVGIFWSTGAHRHIADSGMFVPLNPDGSNEGMYVDAVDGFNLEMSGGSGESAEDSLRSGSIIKFRRRVGDFARELEFGVVKEVLDNTITLESDEGNDLVGFEVMIQSEAFNLASVVTLQDYGVDYSSEDTENGWAPATIVVAVSSDLEARIESTTAEHIAAIDRSETRELTQLRSGRQYVIGVTLDETVDQPELFQHTYLHLPGSPAPPSAPVVESRAATSLTLKWVGVPNGGDGGFPVEYFTVQCSTSSNIDINDPPSWEGYLSSNTYEKDASGRVIPRVTLKSLVPNTWYICRVGSFTEFGHSYGPFNGFQRDIATGAILEGSVNDGRTMWSTSATLMPSDDLYSLAIGGLTSLLCQSGCTCQNSALYREVVDLGIQEIGSEDRLVITFDRELDTNDIPNCLGLYFTSKLVTLDERSSSLAPHPPTEVAIVQHERSEEFGVDDIFVASWTATNKQSSFTMTLSFTDSGGVWDSEELSNVCSDDTVSVYSLTICPSSIIDDDFASEIICDWFFPVRLEIGSFVRFAVQGVSGQKASGWSEAFLEVKRQYTAETAQRPFSEFVGDCNCGWKDATTLYSMSFIDGLDYRVSDPWEPKYGTEETCLGRSGDWTGVFEILDVVSDGTYLKVEPACSFQLWLNEGTGERTDVLPESYAISLSEDITQFSHLEVASKDVELQRDGRMHFIFSGLESEITRSDVILQTGVLSSIGEDAQLESNADLPSIETPAMDLAFRNPLKISPPTVTVNIPNVTLSWSYPASDQGYPVSHFILQVGLVGSTPLRKVITRADIDFSATQLQWDLTGPWISGAQYWFCVQACSNQNSVIANSESGCSVPSDDILFTIPVATSETFHTVHEESLQVTGSRGEQVFFQQTFDPSAELVLDITLTCIPQDTVVDGSEDQGTDDVFHDAVSALLGNTTSNFHSRVAPLGEPVLQTEHSKTTITLPMTQSKIAVGWIALDGAVDTYVCFSQWLTEANHGEWHLSSALEVQRPTEDKPVPPPPPVLHEEEMTLCVESWGFPTCFFVAKRVDDNIECSSWIPEDGITESLVGSHYALNIEANGFASAALDLVGIDEMWQPVTQELYCGALACGADTDILSTYSKTTLFRGPPKVPSPSPLLAIHSVLDTVALVYWEVSESQGSAIHTYSVHCLDTALDEVVVQALDVVADQSLFELYVSDLSPETTYSCWLQATNDVGSICEEPSQSSECMVVTLTTLPTTGLNRRHPIAPKRPFVCPHGPDATNFDGSTVPLLPMTLSSLKVCWNLLCGSLDFPSRCTGVTYNIDTHIDSDFVGSLPSILGYILRYRPLDTAGELEVNEWEYSRYGSTEMETVDYELEVGDGDFEFQIAAYNTLFEFLSDDPSNLDFSRSLELTMPDAMPPNRPVPVDCSNPLWHTAESVFVQLGPLGSSDATETDNNGARVEKYHIQCSPTSEGLWGSDLTRERIFVALQGFAIFNLAPGTEVMCRARAQNSAGWSSWSHNYAQTSFGETTISGGIHRPLRMNQPEASAVSSTVAHLSWTPPEDMFGTAVEAYYVTVHPSDVTIEVHFSLTSVEISGLYSGETYSFTVAAGNKAVLSCNFDDREAGKSFDSPSVSYIAPFSDNSLGRLNSVALPTLSVWRSGSTTIGLIWGADMQTSIDLTPLTMMIEFSVDRVPQQWKVYDAENLLERTTTRIIYVEELRTNTKFLFRLAMSYEITGVSVEYRTYSNIVEGTTVTGGVPLPPIPITESGEGLEGWVEELPRNDPSIGDFRTLGFDIGQGILSPDDPGDAGGYRVVLRREATVLATSIISRNLTIDTLDPTGVFGVEDLDGVQSSSASGLRANTLYSFDVNYVSDSGVEGEVFENYLQMVSSCGSADSVLGTEIIDVSSESLLLRWEHASSAGSEIIGYDLQCSDDVTFSNAVLEVNIDPRFNEWWIAGLTPSRQYWCSVRARAEIVTCSSPPFGQVDRNGRLSAAAGPVLTKSGSSLDVFNPLRLPPPFLPSCDEDSPYWGSASAERSSSDVVVSWASPTLDSVRGKNPNEYSVQLQYRNVLDGEWIRSEPSSSTYQLTGLIATSTYEISVRAVNEFGVGEWSSNFRYPFRDVEPLQSSVPFAPSNVVINDQIRTAVQVSWTVGDNGGSVVYQALIECQRGFPLLDGTDPWTYQQIVGSTNKNIPASTSSYVELVSEGIPAPSRFTASAFGLSEEDDFFYYCRVTTRNSAGWGAPSTVRTIGHEIPVSQQHPVPPPQGTVEETELNSLTISVPAILYTDGSPVRGVKGVLENEFGEVIHATTITGNNATNDQSFVFTGLSPSTKYTFYSICWNRHVFNNIEDYQASSAFSPTLVVQTKEPSRSDSAQMMDLVQARKEELLLRWVAPSDGGSPLTAVSAWCAEGESAKDQVVEALVGQAYARVFEILLCEGIACDVPKIFFSLSNLQAETLYACTSVVENSVGISLGDLPRTPWSTLSEDDEEEPFPVISVDLGSTTQTSATLNWDDPPGFPEEFVVKLLDAMGVVVQEMTVDQTSVTLESLEPNTSYTAVLDGVTEPSVSFTTLPGPPFAPTDTVVLDSLDEIAVMSWQIETRGSEIIDYSVECDSFPLPFTHEDFEATVSVPQVEVHTSIDLSVTGYIPGLTAATTYACRVRGNIEGGNGDWSDFISLKTNPSSIHGQLPLQLREPTLINSAGAMCNSFDCPHLTNTSSFKVTWGDELLTDTYADGRGSHGEGIVGFDLAYGIADEASDDDIVLSFPWSYVDWESGENRYFLVSSLLGGTSYRVRVRAIALDTEDNAYLASIWSPDLIFDLPDATVPDTPDPPRLVDSSPTFLFITFESESNGSPILKYYVSCVSENRDEIADELDSPHFYAFVGYRNQIWTCSGRALNSMGESYQSYTSFNLERNDARQAPLQPHPVNLISSSVSGVRVAFTPPPISCGGTSSPSIAFFELQWSAVDDEGVEEVGDSWKLTIREVCEFSAVSTEDCETQYRESFMSNQKMSFLLDVTGLEPGRTYRFKLRAAGGTVNQLWGPWSEGKEIDTQKPGLPGSVQTLILLDAVESAFLFTWVPPDSNGSPIISYSIECLNVPFEDLRDRDELFVPILEDGDTIVSKTVDGSITEAFLDQLALNTEFYCRVQTCNDVGTSNGIDVNYNVVDGVEDLETNPFTTVSNESPLRLVKPIALTNMTTNSSLSFEITNAPERENWRSYAAEYRIKGWESWTFQAIPYNGTEDIPLIATLEGLKGGTLYEVALMTTLVHDGSFNSPSTVVEAWTLPTSPGPWSKRAARIWLTVSTTAEELVCSNIGETFCGLLSFINCQTTCWAGSLVASISAYGSEDDAVATLESSGLSVSILSERLGVEVVDLGFEDLSLKVVSETNNAIFVEFSPMDSRGSMITKYVVECDAEFDFTGVKYSGTTYLRDDETIELGVGISGLTPDTSYFCRMWSSNAYGDSEPDGVLEHTTLARDELRPPLRAASPFVEPSTSHINAKWTTPVSAGAKDANVVDHYLFYSLDDYRYTELGVYNITLTENPTTISSLRPGQSYQFWVVSENNIVNELLANGVSTLSDASGKTGAQLKPAAPQSPRPCEILLLNETSVLVTLDGFDLNGLPIDGGLPIDRFLFQYKQSASNDWENAPTEYEGSSWPIVIELGGIQWNFIRTVEVDHLLPRIDYDVRHSLVNELGAGEWSEVITFRTEAQPPSFPQNVAGAVEHWGDSSDAWLRVEWGFPTSDGSGGVIDWSICVFGLEPRALYSEDGDEVICIVVDNDPIFSWVYDIGAHYDRLMYTYDTEMYSYRFSTADDIGNKPPVKRGGSYEVEVYGSNPVGAGLPAYTNTVEMPVGPPYPLFGIEASSYYEEVDDTWKILVSAACRWNGGSPYTEVVMTLNTVQTVQVNFTYDRLTDNLVSGTFRNLQKDTRYIATIVATTDLGSTTLTSGPIWTTTADLKGPQAPDTPDDNSMTVITINSAKRAVLPPCPCVIPLLISCFLVFTF